MQTMSSLQNEVGFYDVRQAQRVDKYIHQYVSPADIWSAMKVTERQCGRVSSTDIGDDGRRALSHQAENAITSPSTNAIPSTSTDCSGCLLAASETRSDDDRAAKLRRRLPPHLRHHEWTIDVETTPGTGRRWSDLRQATRRPAADDAAWSAWQPPPTQPPPQLLAMYGAQIWARLVSALLADHLAGSSASASASAATTSAHVRRSSTPRPTADPRGERASVDEAVPQRNSVTNWLLDSPGPSSTSATAVARETTSAFDAARRLPERASERRRFCVDGVGNVDGEGQRRGQVRVCGGRTTTSADNAAGAGGFQCCLCRKRYDTHGAMKMHARTHTLPCRCAVCGKAFSRPWLLQGHVRTHTGERPFACPRCPRAFADRSNLRAHLQTHADVKKYACSHCDKTFSRLSLLVKHSGGAACPPLVPHSG